MEIKLSEREIDDIIEGLHNLFDGCVNRAGDLSMGEEDSILEFQDAMKIGKLMERLLKLKRRCKNHG